MHRPPVDRRRTKRSHLAAAGFLAAALVSAGCSNSSDYTYVEPASVLELEPDLWQVELTQLAAERTGIETIQVVAETVDGVDRLVIPYSAVMYHFDGSTWTYANPEGLVYLRAPIEIDYIADDRAILTDGPVPGTSVVTVGAAELYGVEFGIGK